MSPLLKTLKPTASVYICGDWRPAAAIQRVAEKYLIVRNRITWEREKGRGAKSNWKNCSEDIWYCTVSSTYTFNVDAVKLKRRVIAPYTDDNGQPKDWDKTSNGNYRFTHPSNLWTDLTIPYFLSTRTASSPRAIGDAIQAILSDSFQALLGDFCHEYSADFARRAMADLAFTDADGFYYVADVKTHNLDTQFNMPNLTSVERLARFYEDDHNTFVVLQIQYRPTPKS